MGHRTVRVLRRRRATGMMATTEATEHGESLWAMPN